MRGIIQIFIRVKDLLMTLCVKYIMKWVWAVLGERNLVTYELFTNKCALKIPQEKT